jgi:hypothetical protein
VPARDRVGSLDLAQCSIAPGARQSIASYATRSAPAAEKFRGAVFDFDSRVDIDFPTFKNDDP